MLYQALAGCGPRQRGVDAAELTALLCKMNVKTVRSILREPVKQWSDLLGLPLAPPGRAKRRRAREAGGDIRAAPQHDGGPELPLVPSVGESAQDIGTLDKLAIGSQDIGTLDKLAIGSKVSRSLLDRWRAHPNFAIGMRMAELATFWVTRRLPASAFPDFVTWAQGHWPSSLGNVNHSWHWVDLFAASLTRCLSTCIAADLHGLVPALGIPSFLTRVVDIVSVMGQSLLVVVHVRTNVQGHLVWDLLGAPRCEYRLEARLPLASTFRFHGGPQLVESVVRVEKQYHLGSSSRSWRIALTMADQAIQGPGSVRFSEEEQRLEDNPADPLRDPLRVGVCAFHIADGCAGFVDKMFIETDMFDRFLRLLRQYFGWGAGKLIARAVARRFADIADEDSQHACLWRQRVAEAEGRQDPMESATCRQKAAASEAEAAALHRVGWTKWRQILAPRRDGTRKCAWQSTVRHRYFSIMGVMYWSIRVRMQEVIENARHDAEKAGHAPSDKLGQNSKPMKSLRALGRTLVDINLLVFNLGRADFRNKYMLPYMMLIQTSNKPDLGHACKTALGVVGEMLEATRSLVQMQGITRFISNLFRGHHALLREGRKSNVTKKVLWVTTTTLLTHGCWRYFPELALRLPEILLGGTCRGVPLDGSIFAEPGAAALEVVSKRDGVIQRRTMRFAQVE